MSVKFSIGLKNHFEKFQEEIKQSYPEATEDQIKRAWDKQQAAQAKPQENRVRQNDYLIKRLRRPENIVILSTAACLLTAALFPPVTLVLNGQQVNKSFQFFAATSPYWEIDSGTWAVELFAILAIGLLIRLVAKDLRDIIED